MKIALVSPYDFAYPGGVVNHISCLENQLTMLGHEVKIIAPASRTVSSLGDRFIPVGKPRPVPGSGSIARITLSPWLSSTINAILEREQFQIVHLHEPLMPMLCTTFLRLSRQPTVGTFHASGGKPWYSIGTPLAKLLLNKWMNKLDGRIAVAEPALDYVSRHFPGDYSIIPNGIDTAHFNPDVTPIERFQDGRLNILFVGRLEKRKGLDYLIEAYATVKKEYPHSRLIVVGPGTRLRNKYQKRIARQGLADVEFVGYCSYADLPRYYKTAHVVCAPATGWESFGIVLLEAMAVCCSLVASDIEGYRRVVTPGEDGLLVPPKDGPRLAEAIMTLLADEKLRRRMGENGLVTAKKYDWSVITGRITDLYQKVINEA